jgi:SSS family solute:Na+ symporter
MLPMTLLSFLFFTGLVAFLTWRVTRGTNLNTDEGYFLAGRSLTGIFIAGSLLLTNLSTEQLIGLNAGSFNDGLSVMCWEVVAGMSLVILALVFLPRYLKSGIATIPQFLEERYGSPVRALTAGIFIVAYMLILLPFVLFLGARGLNGMLGLEDLLGFADELKTIWGIIIFIAALGGAYAIWGGMRAIAVSDTFNGAGLLIGGLMITFFSLRVVAGNEGGFMGAFEKIKAADPDAFNSLGGSDEGTHWPTLFTGVLLLNFFYWCTNQQIIQRTFGAKNLAEGQKGVLLAAFFKILAPLILVLPGIIAAYLVIGIADPEMIADVGTNQEGNWVADRAYGALVSKVLPTWFLGFFAAVVVGSILSTFNSVLNSAATLFSLDVYKKYLNPEASTKSVVRSGQICSLLIGIFAVVAAPNIFYGREAIFGFFQTLNGVYFIPLLAIIMVGMFNRYADGKSALITLLVGLGLMIIGTFFTGEVKETETSGWLKDYFGSPFHYMGAVFALLIALQLALSAAGMKRAEPYVQVDAGLVDLTPWKPARYVGAALILLVLAIYAFFAI